MLVRSLSVALMVAGCTFLVGCTRNAKLEVTKSYDVAPGEAQAIELDPQPKAQKLTVDFKSAEDVNVLVFKQADCKDDDALLTADAKKALASKKGKTESFGVDIPENTATRVVVRDPAKKTKVDITISNKK